MTRIERMNADFFILLIEKFAFICAIGVIRNILDGRKKEGNKVGLRGESVTLLL